MNRFIPEYMLRIVTNFTFLIRYLSKYEIFMRFVLSRRDNSLKILERKCKLQLSALAAECCQP